MNSLIGTRLILLFFCLIVHFFFLILLNVGHSYPNDCRGWRPVLLTDGGQKTSTNLIQHNLEIVMGIFNGLGHYKLIEEVGPLIIKWINRWTKVEPTPHTKVRRRRTTRGPASTPKPHSFDNTKCYNLYNIIFYITLYTLLHFCI